MNWIFRSMPKLLDCIVDGSCVVDLLCWSVKLDGLVGAGMLYKIDAV